jgi:hypothetical protein
LIHDKLEVYFVAKMAKDERDSLLSKLNFKAFTYQDLCIENKSAYFELSFSQMKSVFYMHGMDDWTKMLDASKKNNFKMYLSYVAFDPQREDIHDKRHHFFIGDAQGKARIPCIRIALSVVLQIFLLLGSL